MVKSLKDFYFGKGRAAGVKSARFNADSNSVILAFKSLCDKEGILHQSIANSNLSYSNFARGYEAGIALNVAERDRRAAAKAPKLTPKEMYQKKLEQRHSRKLEQERGIRK